jgi:hypothetical protein
MDSPYFDIEINVTFKPTRSALIQFERRLCILVFAYLPTGNVGDHNATLCSIVAVISSGNQTSGYSYGSDCRNIIK